MPYIRRVERRDYDGPIQELVNALHENEWHPGHVNYIFSCIIKEWWFRLISYRTHAEITGVLTDVRDEWKRRLGEPYEDKKCKENGDLERFRGEF